MANMSYCRFQNTLIDLQDCYNEMEDREYNDDEYEELSREEARAKKQLLELCAEITDRFNVEYEVEDAE